MASTPFPTTPSGFIDAANAFTAALNTPEGCAASGLAKEELDGLDAETAALAEKMRAQSDLERAVSAAVGAARAAAEAQEQTYRGLRKRASTSPGMTLELRESAGIGTPEPLGRPGALPFPTNVSATRGRNGAVLVDWDGPTAGGLLYDVEARDDAAGDESPQAADAAWRVLGSVTATDYTDRTLPPGGFRRYRVVARRGERRGAASDFVDVGS